MNVLVAMDESAYADKALDKALELAKADGAKLFVISVAPLVGDTDEMPPGMRRKMEEAAQSVVKRAAEKAKSSGLEVATHVEQSGSTAESIVAYAERSGIDLIVLGHKGKSNLERFLVGSVAQAVAAHAPCSVYLVK